MRFPVHELTHEGDVVASLGRFGWFSIFLGSGQEIGFPDGERWRLGSVRHGGSICPIVIDGRGRRVAVARLGIRNYGINGKDYACVLIPAEPDRIGRANRWTLHYFEHELATVTRRPLTIETYHAVPLGAVFLCFVLARYPLPEEAAPRLPSFRWR